MPEPETGQGDNANSQQLYGRANTYQDVKDISNSGYASMEPKQTVGGQEVATPKKATESVGKKIDVEVRLDLGQNSSAYTIFDHKEKCKKAPAQYRNLDAVVKAPEIYDTSVTDTCYNKLDKTNVNHVVPTDPDDEAYNTVIIGPTRSERAPYDRLDRQKGGSRLSSEDQLDVSIPVAPGYAALGVKDANLAYDKLERHEAHSVDPDRKAGTTEPNTYNELGAMGRKKNYDKLTRQHSGDHGLKDPAKISDEMPRSNEYDTVVIGSPAPQAGGEIYQNLPKTPHEHGLKTEVASPDSKHQKKDLNHHNFQKASPVVRPLYDVIPGSPRAFSAPVYDTLPNSPHETAPVYDTPPACHPMKHHESCEDHTSPGVGGARPVYDRPPVRLDEETCPVYENTPTPRKGSTCI